MKACAYYLAKALLDPGLPPNSGAFRPIWVLTRPGTLMEVQFPGALCNANIVTTQRIVDALMGAFLQIIPERAAAACSGTMNLLNIGGRDPRSGALFNYIETYGGGQGALVDRDGTSAVQMHMTNTRNAPVEVIESTYPFFIHGYGLVPDSAGAGEFRGGYGMRREFEIEADRVTVTLSSDRFELAPWGIFGGRSASTGNCSVILPRRIGGAAPLQGDAGPDQGFPIDQHHSWRWRLGRSLRTPCRAGPSGRGSGAAVEGVGSEHLRGRSR